MNSVILAYFDRPLTPQEAGELPVLLRKNPDAARSFAELARANLTKGRHFAATGKAETVESIAAIINRPVVSSVSFRQPQRSGL